MNNNAFRSESKPKNKRRLVQLVYSREFVSRQEIAQALNLSMPTVFQGVMELLDSGLLREDGEFDSTGGRKAKKLGLNPSYGSAIGVSVTLNHIHLVQTDLTGCLLSQMSSRQPYADTLDYYRILGEHISAFLDSCPGGRGRFLGVGLSIPGLLNKNKSMLRVSHTLRVANVSLGRFKQYIPHPVCFENDATNAAMADIAEGSRDAVYLALNNTVGGAIYINGSLFSGNTNKSAEFGHMVIHPSGRRCYCGKIGCLDAYCAATVLSEEGRGGLEVFFRDLDRAASAARISGTTTWTTWPSASPTSTRPLTATWWWAVTSAATWRGGSTSSIPTCKSTTSTTTLTRSTPM